MKIIFYYQTFSGLHNIINDNNNNVTHIHLSSIHFDENNIHLNDHPPNSQLFDNVWKELAIVSDKQRIKVILMIGGAGGAYTQLFSNFDKYYPMLFNLIKSYYFIEGVDLDIEEYVDSENIIYLIKQLKKDFGNNFIISMAPIQESLESNNSGMGGFIYKDLYEKVGNMIDYFNVQCYSDYSENSLTKMVTNGFPIEKINMGMMSFQYNQTIPKIIKNIMNKNKNFGGVFDWEYNNSVENWNHLIVGEL